jgi:hypothetical protein
MTWMNARSFIPTDFTVTQQYEQGIMNSTEEQQDGTKHSCSGYFGHPFGKLPVLHDRASFLGTAVEAPWHPTRWKDKGNLFLSLLKRGRLHQARQPGACLQFALQEASWMQDQSSSFKGMLTINDAIVVPLDSLLDDRLRCLLVTPPFDSHGAARPRLERQLPWFLLVQWHDRIQRSRGSAAQCLDGVVHG